MTWQPQPTSLQIAVLFGGDSAEREISLASGRCVAGALTEAGHRVELIDPAEVPLDQVEWSRFDACFIALHGGAGEDGRIQQELERRGIAYTGSGPAASRLAMSKSAAKERFAQTGVSTPAHVLFHISEPPDEMRRRVSTLDYPLVIKPDSQGSSLGVVVVSRSDELDAAIDECRCFDQFGLAEPLIVGREFTVAILDRQPLPLIEIIAPMGVFNFDAKYRRSDVEHVFETGLPPSVEADIVATAINAAAAIRTRGLARVDLMLDYEKRVWVLEVNTVPGMTKRSLVPLAARRAGLSMPALCDQLVRDCLITEMAR